MKIKKGLFVISMILLFLLFGNAGRTEAQAKSVMNLKPDQEYKINLDRKGKKETISYHICPSKKYEEALSIKINGKKRLNINNVWTDQGWFVQVLDVDKKDHAMNLWVYNMAWSQDILYSALYEYRKGHIVKVWKMKEDSPENWDEFAYYQRCGRIVSTNGKGRFTVAEDRALQVDSLIGNHIDKVVYRLKNGEVEQVSKRTFEFYETYTSGSGSMGKDKGLKTAGETRFYVNPDKSADTFVVKKGVKCYPQKAYILSDSQIFVMFKMKNGKKGWLCADDYSFEYHPFSNMAFFD